jgi:hypothetical protein
MVEKWCNKMHLSVNPVKSKTVPFQKDLRDLMELTLLDKTLKLFTEIRRLGVILEED